jgi:hypothetical protein
VYPICAAGLFYCPITDGCETICSVGFDTTATNPQFNHTCAAAESFCSNEEACETTVKTPESFSGNVY